MKNRTWTLRSGRRIRLQTWKHKISERRLHKHQWRYIAIPLIGTFNERRYAIGPKGRLEPVAIHRRIPLIPYRCPANVVHSVTPRTGRAHVMLILAGKPRSG